MKATAALSKDLGERLLRISEVQIKTGMSTTTIYRRIAEGRFPKPVKLGPASVRWRESAVNEWIDGLQ